jgi:hypothetical protein
VVLPRAAAGFDTLDKGTDFTRDLSAVGNLFQDYPAFPFRKSQGTCGSPFPNAFLLEKRFAKEHTNRVPLGSNPIHQGHFSPFYPFSRASLKTLLHRILFCQVPTKAGNFQTVPAFLSQLLTTQGPGTYETTKTDPPKLKLLESLPNVIPEGTDKNP